MSKTSLKTTEDWQSIAWRKLERRVYKLQKRIFRASQRGEVKTVRRLQKTLMRSWSAKCLAVRRVSQDNQGKQTAGVDGIKSLKPEERLELVQQLALTQKAKPTRRVWLPKPGSEEKRPLGIPTMHDRALQALVKQALEPEWEAHFEPNSYGFRPGRSAQDAIEAIYTAINQKAKYALDADISKCFDQINHEALLAKLNTFPTLRRQIRAWLKAGVMDGEQLFSSTEGTPQGGVISPLLANIALHGMEESVKRAFPKMSRTMRETWFHQKGTDFASPNLIRYADDFVILHEDIKVIQRCKEIISEWLAAMGLELKPSKTRLTHTLKGYEQEMPGFDFLGFNVRQYAVGKFHSAKSNQGKLLGFKTIITPAKRNQKEHHRQLAEVIKAYRAAPQTALISRLNPMIRGWSNYFATVISKEIFSKQDAHLYRKLRAWGKRRHPQKSEDWVSKKYWHSKGGKNWLFAGHNKDDELCPLLSHVETPIVRHVKVKGQASPFDGNLVYWSIRMGQHPETPKRVAKLLKRQKGKCFHCDLIFREGDLMEVDHKVPKAEGGKDCYNNLQLLHRHCHDTKTATDKAAQRYACQAPNH